jgi:hypothetical protein
MQAGAYSVFIPIEKLYKPHRNMNESIRQHSSFKARLVVVDGWANEIAKNLALGLNFHS